MTKTIKRFNAQGIEAFRSYLGRLREESAEALPTALLEDPSCTESLAHEATISSGTFKNGYELGAHVASALKTFDRQSISRDHGLWAWLALYFFDHLCPAQADGKRYPLEDAVYLLSPTFQHNRYYRHAVRTPWLSVMTHGENAKVLLITVGAGTRSDIFEQLASRQGLFENQTIIAGARALYFDSAADKPRRGAGGKGPGSARRLATIVQQLDLTYDLLACDVKRLLSLLPKEFGKFLPAAQNVV